MKVRNLLLMSIAVFTMQEAVLNAGPTISGFRFGNSVLPVGHGFDWKVDAYIALVNAIKAAASGDTFDFKVDQKGAGVGTFIRVIDKSGKQIANGVLTAEGHQDQIQVLPADADGTLRAEWTIEGYPNWNAIKFPVDKGFKITVTGPYSFNTSVPAGGVSSPLPAQSHELLQKINRVEAMVNELKMLVNQIITQRPAQVPVVQKTPTIPAPTTITPTPTTPVTLAQPVTHTTAGIDPAATPAATSVVTPAATPAGAKESLSSLIVAGNEGETITNLESKNYPPDQVRAALKKAGFNKGQINYIVGQL